MERVVIDDILKYESKSLSSSVQLDIFERGTTEMEFDTVASTSVLTSQNLVDSVVQEVTHEHVHIEATFTLVIGRNRLIYLNMKQVSFHLEKDWDNSKYFRRINLALRLN